MYKIKMPNIFLYQYMSITYASIIITCPAHAPVHAKFLWKQAHKNCVIQKIFIYCRKLKGKFFLAIEMYLENVLCNFRRFITFENLVVFVHNVIFQSCIKCPEVLAIASLILKDLFFSWKDANIDKVHWIPNICKLTVNFRHFCWLLQCVVCYLEAPNCYIHKFNSIKQAINRLCLSVPRTIML